MRNHSSLAHPPLPDEVCREALPSFILYQIRVREQACWINNPGKRACHAPCFEEEAAPEIVVMLDQERNSGKIPAVPRSRATPCQPLVCIAACDRPSLPRTGLHTYTTNILRGEAFFPEKFELLKTSHVVELLRTFFNRLSRAGRNTSPAS